MSFFSSGAVADEYAARRDVAKALAQSEVEFAVRGCVVQQLRMVTLQKHGYSRKASTAGIAIVNDDARIFNGQLGGGRARKD